MKWKRGKMVKRGRGKKDFFFHLFPFSLFHFFILSVPVNYLRLLSLEHETVGLRRHACEPAEESGEMALVAEACA